MSWDLMQRAQGQSFRQVGACGREGWVHQVSLRRGCGLGATTATVQHKLGRKGLSIGAPGAATAGTEFGVASFLPFAALHALVCVARLVWGSPGDCEAGILEHKPS